VREKMTKPRGVYKTVDVAEGWVRFTVFDRHGECIRESRVRADKAGPLTDRWVRDWLELVDPAPLLRIVG
jgi:hypothetical protein